MEKWIESQYVSTVLPESKQAQPIRMLSLFSMANGEFVITFELFY